MTTQQELSLAPNGRGAQAYLSRDVLEDSACPLDQGQSVRAIVYRDIGILLVPAVETREFEVTIHV